MHQRMAIKWGTGLSWTIFKESVQHQNFSKTMCYSTTTQPNKYMTRKYECSSEIKLQSMASHLSNIQWRWPFMLYFRGYTTASTFHLVDTHKIRWATLPPPWKYQTKLQTHLRLYLAATKRETAPQCYNEVTTHDDVIKWDIFRVTGQLWAKFTRHLWIPLTKSSDAKLWCLLWSTPEQTAEQTIEMPVIWGVIALIITSL